MTNEIFTPALAAVSYAAAAIAEKNISEPCVKRTVIRQSCKKYGVDLDAFIEAATQASAAIRRQLA